MIAQFSSEESFPAELDRVINITDGVLRSLIVLRASKGEHMINVVAIMGRLTYDPELRTTPTGVSVVRFQVAVDRNFQRAGRGAQGRLH